MVYIVLLDVTKFPFLGAVNFSQSFLKSDLSHCCCSACSSLASPGFGGHDQVCIHSAVSRGPGQAQIPTHSCPPPVPFPSWILFDEKNFEGDQHILSEGEFPTLTAMGCLASTVLGSLRKVPLVSTPVQFQAVPEAGVLPGVSQASCHCAVGGWGLSPVFLRTSPGPPNPGLQSQLNLLEIFRVPAKIGPGDNDINRTQPPLQETQGHKMALLSCGEQRGGSRQWG